MKKTIAVMQVLFLLIFMGCQSTYFFEMSQAINNCQLENNNVNSDIFHQIRIKLKPPNKITFAHKIDTIYVVESSDFQSGEIFGQIWNSKSEFNYIYRNNNFSFQKDKIFDGYMLELIEKWDLNEIRRQEAEHSNMTPSYRINASRVIYAKHRIKVECTSFKDFYNPDKER